VLVPRIAAAAARTKLSLQFGHRCPPLSEKLCLQVCSACSEVASCPDDYMLLAGNCPGQPVPCSSHRSCYGGCPGRCPYGPTAWSRPRLAHRCGQSISAQFDEQGATRGRRHRADDDPLRSARCRRGDQPLHMTEQAGHRSPQGSGGTEPMTSRQPPRGAGAATFRLASRHPDFIQRCFDSFAPCNPP
jgi:hypothetical protein